MALGPGDGTLYVAGGDWAGAERSHLRSFRIDGATGRIQPLSFQVWEPAHLRPPLSIAANRTRAYVVGGAPFTGTHGGWRGFDTRDGVVGPAYPLPDLVDPSFVFADAASQRAFAVANDADQDYDSSLFTFAVAESGALDTLDVVGLPSTERVPYYAALHPAGTMLYVSGAGRGTRSYRITTADRLDLVGEAVEGGGPIVALGLPGR